MNSGGEKLTVFPGLCVRPNLHQAIEDFQYNIRLISWENGVRLLRYCSTISGIVGVKDDARNLESEVVTNIKKPCPFPGHPY